MTTAWRPFSGNDDVEINFSTTSRQFFFLTTDRDNILVIEHTKSSSNRRAQRERVRHLEGLTALWIRSISQELVV
ncbi:hypothetical protein M6B38_236720 [Iris pallida]|uniref:Uncharacterized protein n=1 Tax=Iris pallida TaxID=29817 RepID=A0AAX6DNU6_IRIPA|nr:hypothetical protein M6B38_236720 [Iris pallida]